MLVWQIRNLTEARAYAQRDSDVRGGIVDYMRVQYAECFLSCYCYRRLGNQNIKLVGYPTRCACARTSTSETGTGVAGWALQALARVA